VISSDTHLGHLSIQNVSFGGKIVFVASILHCTYWF